MKDNNFTFYETDDKTDRTNQEQAEREYHDTPFKEYDAWRAARKAKDGTPVGTGASADSSRAKPQCLFLVADDGQVLSRCSLEPGHDGEHERR